MKNPTYFDIETEPLAESEIQQFMPEFKAPSNYKDEEKIKKYIDDSKVEWLEKAALSPITGKILVIGTFDEFFEFSETESEGDLIQNFWDTISEVGVIHNRLIGFNCHAFDIPFLMRRSWKLGIKPPNTLLRDYRYINDLVIDLMQIWRCGNREQTISLNDLGLFLGVGSKNGDNSKNFHKLWKENRQEAICHLENDIMLLKRCSEKMGI